MHAMQQRSLYSFRTTSCHSVNLTSNHQCRRRPCDVARAVGTAQHVETVDVAVVGAGIIGLCVARKLLTDTELSVALLDAKQPCAGATGAGQGYIWMAHRDPNSPSWVLARRSKAMWEQLAAATSDTPLGRALEWQANGSLLLGTTEQEVQQLQARARMLQEQGIQGVLLLSPRELKMAEPALQLPTGSHGLLVKSDAQINGKRTAFAMLEDCQQLASSTGSSSSRLLLGLQEPVVALEPAGGSTDVVTQKRRVRARKGVVIAAGVWSGKLLAAATGQPAWAQLLQPRRGHLLELQPPAGMPPIHTGMMELSYTQHYSTAAAHATGPACGSSTGVDITFTATTSATGALLIGSSREFSGWESAPDADIITAIMSRASAFLPDLKHITAQDLLDTTRVGLRPFAVGGLPAIGRVAGLPGVAVAAGHEGSGLCLGPATAELILHQLSGFGLDGSDDNLVTPQQLLAAAEALSPERRLQAAAAQQQTWQRKHTSCKG